MNHEFQWRSEMRKLAGDAQPQRDLWPQIAARIAVRPATSRWRMGLGLAATVLVAAGVVALAWRTQSANTIPIAATAPAYDATSMAADNAPLAWAVPADPAFAAASRDLDSASVQLQQALEQQPQAVFLVGLLNRTNAQRMRLLRQAPSV
ncbi:MAG TPA: hypothetical protein VL425_07120 [Rudaea sp.]|jgi:hypothetical protein|nr:hypothetical protein [Rudaea sp.]